MSYSSWKQTAFPTRKDTDLNLVMRGVMELITKPCLGQWMFCVIWLSLCLSIHLSSSSIHPNHHPIAITTISNTAVSSVRPAAAASPQEGLARERGCHAKHILWRHRLAMNIVIFKDSLKDWALCSCDIRWKLGFYSNGEKTFPAFMAANQILKTLTASTSKTQNLDCKCKVRI